VIPNAQGHSAWFIYVNNPTTPGGRVDQSVQGYILSDQGRPLVPAVDPDSGSITYYEVATRGDVITGQLRGHGEGEGGLIEGTPFLYYPYKVIEIASHLLGDVFGSAAGDDGTGTDFHKNLLTYLSNVQAWLQHDGKLDSNLYNTWSGKYAPQGGQNYFGDGSIADVGMRVDTDSTCSHPTNTFLHLVDDIVLTPGNTDVAENMSCGLGEALTFDQQNFLMLNKNTDGAAVTTYFVTKYNQDEQATGCNMWLGYTVVTPDPSSPFTAMNVLPFDADTNKMMSKIVENVSAAAQNIVRVAETYLHECGHQCGLLHDTDAPDCENDTTLHISKLMNPGGNIRRAYTRWQWCMVRGSTYITSRSLDPFTQTPELPDSGTMPPAPPK
jgi:hypothetical protein